MSESQLKDAIARIYRTPVYEDNDKNKGVNTALIGAIHDAAVLSGIVPNTLTPIISPLSERDRARLLGVKAPLVRVVEEARKHFPFIVVEGVRTMARQRELYDRGATLTLRSKHLTGDAVDLAPWKDKDSDGKVDTDEIDWNDIQSFRDMAGVVVNAADSLRVAIRWGGTFRTASGKPWFDGPHFELV